MATGKVLKRKARQSYCVDVTQTSTRIPLLIASVNNYRGIRMEAIWTLYTQYTHLRRADRRNNKGIQTLSVDKVTLIILQSTVSCWGSCGWCLALQLAIRYSSFITNSFITKQVSSSWCRLSISFIFCIMSNITFTLTTLYTMHISTWIT